MYKPSRESKKILDAAYRHIESVPYKTSLRWLFYRLLQEGYYSDKTDYKKWTALASVARKRFYKKWHPETLHDDTRSVELYNGGYWDEETLRYRYFRDLISDNPVFLDHFVEQDEFIFICFEARAMADQFRYYTDRINLVAFGGDPSIHLKWEIAKKIEHWADYYGKEVNLLYFGDYDSKGQKIVESAVKDIREWCNYYFVFTHCGLTFEQALLYDIPENPEKPGEYQWEALDDDGAAKIIRESINKFINVDIISSLKKHEDILTKEFKDKLDVFLRFEE